MLGDTNFIHWITKTREKTKSCHSGETHTRARDIIHSCMTMNQQWSWQTKVSSTRAIESGVPPSINVISAIISIGNWMAIMMKWRSPPFSSHHLKRSSLINQSKSYEKWYFTSVLHVPLLHEFYLASNLRWTIISNQRVNGVYNVRLSVQPSTGRVQYHILWV